MKSVEFIKHWKAYIPGDIAGFEPELAETLIEGKVAKAYEAETKPAKAATK
jgi:hypothetical protein